MRWWRARRKLSASSRRRTVCRQAAPSCCRVPWKAADSGASTPPRLPPAPPAARSATTCGKRVSANDAFTRTWGRESQVHEDQGQNSWTS